jgi:hypothetical protein
MSDFDLATLAREAREQVHPGEPPLDAITAPTARDRGATGSRSSLLLPSWR